MITNKKELTIYTLLQGLEVTPAGAEKDKLVYERWYDWFCKDTSLVKKGYALIGKLKQIVFSKKFDINRTYVFFKNNCPMRGKLYDDFRICSIETGDVIYTITPKSGFEIKQGVSEVWGKENNFKEPIITGSWKQVVEWFLK